MPNCSVARYGNHVPRSRGGELLRSSELSKSKAPQSSRGILPPFAVLRQDAAATLSVRSVFPRLLYIIILSGGLRVKRNFCRPLISRRKPSAVTGLGKSDFSRRRTTIAPRAMFFWETETRCANVLGQTRKGERTKTRKGDGGAFLVEHSRSSANNSRGRATPI
jgi:hypothetical protein